MSKQDQHSDAVQAISAQVKQFYADKQTVKIYHGSTNSTRPFGADGHKYVDVSVLNSILEVNADQGYIVVEPNVAMDQLLDAAMAAGCVPPMVPEFPGITVGGAVQGGSGESSSFKQGGFEDTCLEYEIVLGNGEVITASRTKNADLFWAMSCAYGSLGIITKLKIKLLPATKFVHLRYYKTESNTAALASITKHTSDKKVDFVDGILFAKNHGVIMIGSYSNGDALPRAEFHRWTDDWFYIHAQKIAEKHESYEEVIPLRDYLFRYDRGAFWSAKYVYEHVPFHRSTRLLAAGLLKTRTMYKMFQGSHYSYRFLVQDVCMPEQTVAQLLEYSDAEHGIYPLWLCPLKPAEKLDKLAPTSIDADMVINVGIWGDMKPARDTFTDRNRQLESKVRKLGGRKVLYAHSYYTEREFWNIYDKKWYDSVRTKYAATVVFPDVYAKTTTRPAKHKPSKFRGLLALLNSPYKS
jgi:delta24-sterol reductase